MSAQRLAIEAAAEANGWTITAWYRDDGETGRNTIRPALREALRLIAEGGAAGLIAAKLDRVARSVIDFAELLAWFTAGGKTLAILDPALDTSTPSGRLIANIFASVAEWETDTIAARTSEALQAKRAAGPISTKRPAVADDLELAGRILTMRESGMTLTRIAKTLNAEQVPTVRGGTTWRGSSVQSVLGYRRPPATRKRADLPEIQWPRRGTG